MMFIRLLQCIIRDCPDIYFICHLYDRIRIRLETKSGISLYVYNELHGFTTNPSEHDFDQIFRTRLLLIALDTFMHQRGIYPEPLLPMAMVFGLSIGKSKINILPKATYDRKIIESCLKNYVQKNDFVSKCVVYKLLSNFMGKIKQILLTQESKIETRNSLHFLTTQSATTAICYYSNAQSLISDRVNLCVESSGESFYVQKRLLTDNSPYFEGMLRADNFRESFQEKISLTDMTIESLRYLVHLISGCRNCSTVSNQTMDFQLVSEIYEVANRFILKNELLTFIEKSLASTFIAEEFDLVKSWQTYRRYINFPFSNWRKYMVVVALKTTMSVENWKEAIEFNEKNDLPFLIEDYLEFLKI